MIIPEMDGKDGQSMEIERKFLIEKLPKELERYPHTRLEQGYLCTSPVVRVRRDGDDYYLTYKSAGLMAREEYNLPLNETSYNHLKEKADGRIISKTRYRIPLTETLTIELDVFDPPFAPLYLAEVEFPSIPDAKAFIPPEWFGKEVTEDPAYHNSVMSLMK